LQQLNVIAAKVQVSYRYGTASWLDKLQINKKKKRSKEEKQKGCIKKNILSHHAHLQNDFTQPTATLTCSFIIGTSL